MRILRLALAQINVTVGDLEGNRRKIETSLEEAREREVDLVAFPELCVTGYPPEDLLLKPQFISNNQTILNELVKKSRKLTAVIGYVDQQEDLYNAAAVVHDGRLVYVYHKAYLPNYGVFDENRYFQQGLRHSLFTLNGVRVGVSICEDIWYPEGPPYLQARAGAELLVNINASPYHAGKAGFRERMLATRAQDNGVVVAYVNLVGGQDELVFDGRSLVFNENGELLLRGHPFEEELLVVDLDLDSVFRARLHDPRRRKERRSIDFPAVDCFSLSGKPLKKREQPIRSAVRPDAGSSVEEVYGALVLGVRDYVRKNGFSKVLIGLSGGIDSSVTVAIAVDALGSDNVVGVFMPSRYTSVQSREDVEQLVKNLGIKLWVLPIDKPFQSLLDLLSGTFSGLSSDVTEENLQSRVRGNLLMALSNKFGWLVLTTGNKSEMSVGYATLYGDMAGGFAVIKDVFKTRVYELAGHRNGREGRPCIPERVIVRAPTAELKENQRDQDTLPPYDLLDRILQAYVEEDRTVDEILEMGYPKTTVAKVIAMVDATEFKRRQAPVGIKITPRALGKDRRMPITNRYRGVRPVGKGAAGRTSKTVTGKTRKEQR